MASLNIQDMELEKYPLNQEAKESLNLLLWDVSDRIGSDCVNFDLWVILQDRMCPNPL